MNSTQRELKLNHELISGLRLQGFYATKTSDRFLSGKPDTRIGHSALGQLDFELKYKDVWTGETGMTKLQWLTMEQMNESGMPTVCLVYVADLEQFVITTLLRLPLTHNAPRVKLLAKPKYIDGHELFSRSMEVLREQGYAVRN